MDTTLKLPVGIEDFQKSVDSAFTILIKQN